VAPSTTDIWVVRFVSHATSELAHHLDPLGLPQAVLGTAALRDIENEENGIPHVFA
jgi:hypothetical protein